MNSWKPRASETTQPVDSDWHWPVDVTRYDRRVELSPVEAGELAAIAGRPSGRHGHWSNRMLEALQRLRQPVMDVLAWTGARHNARCSVLAVLVIEMHRRQQAFWGWSADQWSRTICLSGVAFQARYQGPHDSRSHLLALSYLLCDFTDLEHLGAFDRLSLARKVFGRERVDAVIQRVVEVVTGWGYRASHAERHLHLPICEVLLANRSPRLEDLSVELLSEQRQKGSQHVREGLLVVSRALAGLGIFPEPLPKARLQDSDEYARDPTRGVAPEWVGWCQRWQDTSTLAPKTRVGYYSLLLRSGRWVTRQHPEAVSPENWTRALAAEYVAAVDRMKIGDWAQSRLTNRGCVGQPISAKGKHHYLGAMSSFFRDLQEWGWIRRNFDPRRCFAVPRAVRALMDPNPRVIAEEVWAKLLWAGLNLGEADLPVSHHGKEYFYPLSMTRCLALVWLFAGLRIDEIYRLRVGCVRWQSQDGTLHGLPEKLSEEAICLLEIPTNKTSPAFIKPVDRVVGEAIVEWERLRPSQPPARDSKTGELVHFLFTARGRPLGKGYLNGTLIPLLCQKAGIQASDARGRITSHRARSTIATQLANARDPMTLLELQAWLGHRHAASTLNYVTTTPTRLARAYADAGYFERNLRVIEVLLDQEVIQSGRAAGGEPWKYYDLGHGYCTYDFFDQCPHRMACAKCGFYVPKDSSQALFLEGKANLQRMLQAIPLLEDERAAVEDGVAAYEKLLARLIDIPTPAGPTPRQLTSPDLIPLTAISISPQEPGSDGRNGTRPEPRE
jgi:integrase